MADIVIGSGPSGVSAAKALLDRGRDVLMIDAGKTLEAENASRRDEMATHQPQGWDETRRDAYQQGQFETPDGQARRYGSDFAMEPANATLSGKHGWFGLRSSRAGGGLSNLWGGAVLPYRQQDIADWPVNITQLAPHYAAVAEFMPVSGAKDGLCDLLPGIEMAGRSPVPPGPQARNLLERLSKKSDRLALDGIHFGAARQAVDGDCKACGMCLHGCPWGYIYSSQRTLSELKSHPRFTYRPNTVALSFSENSTGVGIALEGGETLSGERLFIGAGVLETARIVLASDPSGTREITLLDSQHAFVPMLHRWRSTPRPDALPYTTLPQLFVEIDAPDVSPNLVHAQLYTWNEHFARDLISNYGFGLGITKPVLNAVARRLIVAQVFLHSQHSSRINLHLSGDGKLIPTLQPNPQTPVVLKSARQNLSRAMGRVGMTTLSFATRLGPAGSSFHVGGSVPMSANPVTGQSDTLGRPLGLSRVHLVDASVFPSIPATTITFSVMANAHRIAASAP